jgi:hypothetical protein
MKRHNANYIGKHRLGHATMPVTLLLARLRG